MKRFLLCLLLAGCEPYIEPEAQEPLRPTDRGSVLVFAVDVSGSFIEEMFGNDGRAYRFMLLSSDRLFRDRMGENDHILLAQLSANNRPLLWEGTPRALRRKFGSSETLKEFIISNSDGNGSRLLAGVADTLEYIQGVHDGQVTVYVLSDMLDNSPTRTEDYQRMLDALTEAKQRGIRVGFYFVDVGLAARLRTALLDAGLDNCTVEAGILEEPPLPVF